jgi:hypothetical protein
VYACICVYRHTHIYIDTCIYIHINLPPNEKARDALARTIVGSGLVGILKRAESRELTSRTKGDVMSYKEEDTCMSYEEEDAYLASRTQR